MQFFCSRIQYKHTVVPEYKEPFELESRLNLIALLLWLCMCVYTPVYSIVYAAITMYIFYLWD